MNRSFVLFFFVQLLGIGISQNTMGRQNELVLISHKFERLALEIRRHRSAMLNSLDEEHRSQVSELSIGQESIMFYLRWRPYRGLSPQSFTISWFDVSDQKTQHRIEVPKNAKWELNWFRFLMPRPKQEYGRIQIEIEYVYEEIESLFRTNLISFRKTVSAPVFLGTENKLGLMLSTLNMQGEIAFDLKTINLNDLIFNKNTLEKAGL